MITRRDQLGTVILTTGLLAFQSFAEDRLHELKDPHGRTVTAHIMSYDSNGNTVVIKRTDEQLYTVNLDIFGEDSQEYIHNWGYEYEFYNALSISADIEQYDLPTIDFGSEYSDAEIENFGFIISLQNPTATTFEEIEINYCYYYRQIERKAQGERCVETGVQCGQFTLESLEPGSEQEFPTETVLLYDKRATDVVHVEETQLFGQMSRPLDSAEGSIIGLRLRATVTSPSGERITRQIFIPDKLPRSAKWTKKSLYTKLNMEHEVRKAGNHGLFINVINNP